LREVSLFVKLLLLMKVDGKIDFKAVLGKKRELVWQEIEKYLNDLICFPKYCPRPDQTHKLN